LYSFALAHGRVVYDKTKYTTLSSILQDTLLDGQGSVKVVRCVILNRSEGSFLNLKEDSSLRFRVTNSTAIGLFGDFDGALA
jgi:hypothetical protein